MGGLVLFGPPLPAQLATGGPEASNGPCPCCQAPCYLAEQASDWLGKGVRERRQQEGLDWLPPPTMLTTPKPVGLACKSTAPPPTNQRVVAVPGIWPTTIQPPGGDHCVQVPQRAADPGWHR